MEARDKLRDFMPMDIQISGAESRLTETIAGRKCPLDCPRTLKKDHPTTLLLDVYGHKVVSEKIRRGLSLERSLTNQRRLVRQTTIARMMIHKRTAHERGYAPRQSLAARRRTLESPDFRTPSHRANRRAESSGACTTEPKSCARRIFDGRPNVDPISGWMFQ